MKSSALANILAGAVMVCALMTAWVSLRYYFAMREWQRLQSQYANMNNVRMAAQQLANEAVEYSRTHTNIDAILYEFDVKPRPGTNAALPGINPRPGPR